jgi:hypothetical protein
MAALRAAGWFRAIIEFSGAVAGTTIGIAAIQVA